MSGISRGGRKCCGPTLSPGEMDEASFKKYFPDLKGVISLPKKKDPVTVKDK
jgi:hypothetical protein